MLLESIKINSVFLSVILLFFSLNGCFQGKQPEQRDEIDSLVFCYRIESRRALVIDCKTGEECDTLPSRYSSMLVVSDTSILNEINHYIDTTDVFENHWNWEEDWEEEFIKILIYYPNKIDTILLPDYSNLLYRKFCGRRDSALFALFKERIKEADSVFYTTLEPKYILY